MTEGERPLALAGDCAPRESSTTHRCVCSCRGTRTSSHGRGGARVWKRGSCLYLPEGRPLRLARARSSFTSVPRAGPLVQEPPEAGGLARPECECVRAGVDVHWTATGGWDFPSRVKTESFYFRGQQCLPARTQRRGSGTARGRATLPGWRSRLARLIPTAMERPFPHKPAARH